MLTYYLPEIIPDENQLRAIVAFLLDRTRYENDFRSIIIESWLPDLLENSNCTLLLLEENLSKDIEKWRQLNTKIKKELDLQTIKNTELLCNHSIQQRKQLLQQVYLTLNDIQKQLQDDKKTCQQLTQSMQAIEEILNSTQPGQTAWRETYQQSHRKLEKQHNTFFENFSEIQKNKKIQQYNKDWGEQAQTIFQLIQTLDINKSWEIKLNQTLDKIGTTKSKPDDWQTLFTLYCLFTYDKKTFFIQALNENNKKRILNDLTLVLDQKPELINPKKALRYFDKEIQLIQQRLTTKRTAVMEKYHVGIKFLLILGLALTEQPAYKIGTLAYGISYDSIHNSERAQRAGETIDTIGNKYMPISIQPWLNPERDKKIIQQFMGLLCFYFCVIQGTSSSMDYIYLAAAMIIQILFSELDTCISIGEKIKVAIYPQHRIDEMSIRKNETAMHWLLGLTFYWMMCEKKYWIPVTLSYIAATTMATTSSMLIDRMSKYMQWNPQVAALGKLAVYPRVYRWTYSSSFGVGTQFFQPEEITTAQALKKLNLSEDASIEEIRKSYYKIALECHPDKNNHCEQDFMQATQAYDYLQSSLKVKK